MKSKTRTEWQRVLAAGIGFSAVLLLSAALMAWHTVHQIDQSAKAFAEHETAAKDSIEAVEQKQHELNGRWLQLARKKDVVRREEILDQLSESRREMTRTLETAYEQGEFLRESIYEEGHGLLVWTAWTFGGCVALWLTCAAWAVRASTGLFRRLENQAAQLTQLQYQFLESQENTARRFSHELHDELGQALTAIKANLSALRGNNTEPRVEDCMGLVDRAIQDVREMSQLLRPTVLDDFGLDAALRALTERFSQRTGIQVLYSSALGDERLPEQAETNFFRIAQEALTNVARHSQATEVSINIARNESSVLLAIHDNGRGMANSKPGSLTGHLGIAGMETRAQACGGSLHIVTAPGQGMKLEAACPIAK